MSLLKRVRPYSAAILTVFWSAICLAQDAPLSIRISVSLANGQPASGATIQSFDGFDPTVTQAVTDDLGEATLSGEFLGGLRLHVISGDGRQQAIWSLPEAEVRTVANRRVTLKLASAVPHEVVVVADEKPVEGSTVLLAGHVFRRTAETGADGRARVWYPADDPIVCIVAWHPQKGVAGDRDYDSPDFGTETRLELLPPANHVVRVVDVDGKPVSGLPITASVRVKDREWIMSRDVPGTRVQTDAKGEVRFPWFPARDLQYVDVEILDETWKEDDSDLEGVPDGLTVVHLRPRIAVTGRVVVPDNANASGLLLTGFGFGTGHTGDIPRARTRPDGAFTMRLAAAHGYVMGVADTQWSSELWSGAIIPVPGDAPRTVELKAYPATPVEFHVTRGSSREPVRRAWINIDRRGSVKWTDEKGESRSGSAGVQAWLRTDDDGIARTGVGLGEVELRLTARDWKERKTIKVADRDPVRVEFHREWAGDRTLLARPVLNGSEYRPSASARVLAWTDRTDTVDKIHQAKVSADGIVELTCDEKEVTLVLLDSEKGISGFAKVPLEKHQIDLAMTANAAYSGKLIDRRDGRPLGSRKVKLLTEGSFLEVDVPCETAEDGAFSFSSAPANIPLRISVEDDPKLPDYFVFDCERLFKANEQRSNDVAKASLMDGDEAVPDKPPETSISKRLESTVENCRAMGMKTLLILEGSEVKRTAVLAGRLTNAEEVKVVARYLPVRVTAAQQLTESDVIASNHWPTPAGNEIILLLMGNAKTATQQLRLDCSNSEAAFEAGKSFLESHAPTTHNGRDKFEAAKAEAKKSDRAVWLILGGPRCGPCFRLARWIDRHRPVLEKDLVIVKVTSGLDSHSDELTKEFDGDKHGIPFHVVMSPDGQILKTSESELGNIGMPSTIEGRRHFETMFQTIRKRMTIEELASLIESVKVSD